MSVHSGSRSQASGSPRLGLSWPSSGLSWTSWRSSAGNGPRPHPPRSNKTQTWSGFPISKREAGPADRRACTGNILRRRHQRYSWRPKFRRMRSPAGCARGARLNEEGPALAGPSPLLGQRKTMDSLAEHVVERGPLAGEEELLLIAPLDEKAKARHLPGSSGAASIGGPPLVSGSSGSRWAADRPTLEGTWPSRNEWEGVRRDLAGRWGFRPARGLMPLRFLRLACRCR